MLNFKTDYNYLDLSGYPADPVNATNDMFDITANADMHALDRFGRAVLKIDYEFGNGTTLRSVIGLPGGPDGIPRRPRRHERRQQHLRRHGATRPSTRRRST